MEIAITNPRFNESYIMRRCSYKPWRDPRNGDSSFIRRLGRSYYPRFHVKTRRDANNVLIFDLHLDARRPMHRQGVRSYEDEESQVVQAEAARIQSLLAR
ncbi:hypothetical protein KJ903_00545 [Patescibacteria group bacterium]|nr:hypothetical protein [Patescibacteria group bacterium]